MMKRVSLILIPLILLFLIVSLSYADDEPPEETQEVNGKWVSISTTALSSQDIRSVRVPGLITTDFEPLDTFAPGPCGGQNGWSMFGGSPNEGHIDTVNPAGGIQHLRISYDATLGSPALTGCFSPLMGPRNNTHDTLTVDVAISSLFGADYDVVGQAPFQGVLTFRVKFSWLGDILVLDDPGTGLGFVDTGLNWVAGPYQTLMVDVNAPANTIDYYYGGALIYSGIAGIFAGDSVEQVVLLSDNFHFVDDGDFDNLRLTSPGPTNIALSHFAVQNENRPPTFILIAGSLLVLTSIVLLLIKSRAGRYPSR